jgi:hypothetical protein
MDGQQTGQNKWTTNQGWKPDSFSSLSISSGISTPRTFIEGSISFQSLSLQSSGQVGVCAAVVTADSTVFIGPETGNVEGMSAALASYWSFGLVGGVASSFPGI